MIRKAALQIGVSSLLAFIAWNAYLAVTHLRSVEKSAALTLGSSAIQAELSGVLKDVTDMEAGQRGYLLTGNGAYLQPYADGKARIGMDFANLRAGLSTRTQRERSLESQLESLATSKQAEMERSISLRQQGYRRRSFKLVDTDEGNGYMDEIRRIASSLSSSESSNFTVSASQMGRMPHRIRLRCDEAGRNFQPVSDTNDEKSWSRLWHEAHRVNNNCAKFVFPADDCGANRREILTFMRSECTTNIFKNDEGRCPPLFAELLHEAPERPESP